MPVSTKASTRMEKKGHSTFPTKKIVIKKMARKYAWIAAVKAGGSIQVSKNIWQVEVRRLSIALRQLYDAIDMQLNKNKIAL